jgi:hypothetical protein
MREASRRATGRGNRAQTARLGVHRLTGLTAIAVVAGLALLWVWQRFSNRERVALAKRQMRARLYAIRLYADEPAMVLRAQGELLIWTGRYLAQMLRPMAIASVPLLVLSVQLDNIYGHRPPAPGDSAIVTAQFGGGTDVRALGATLEGRGVVVETPGVRIPSRRQVCWRVRAIPRLKAAPPGSVLLRAGGVEISQAIRCGHAWWERPPRIEVSCSAATVDVFGFDVDWAVWFLIVSGITMLALRLERRSRPGGRLRTGGSAPL